MSPKRTSQRRNGTPIRGIGRGTDHFGWEPDSQPRCGFDIVADKRISEAKLNPSPSRPDPPATRELLSSLDSMGPEHPGYMSHAPREEQGPGEIEPRAVLQQNAVGPGLLHETEHVGTPAISPPRSAIRIVSLTPFAGDVSGIKLSSGHNATGPDGVRKGLHCRNAVVRQPFRDVCQSHKRPAIRISIQILLRPSVSVIAAS